MSRARSRGAALPVALLVLLVTSVVTGGIAELARSEVTIARHRRALTRGLAAVDACATAAIATLPAAVDWSSQIRGADGVAGTADDGIVVTPAGCAARLADGPLGGRRPRLDVAVVVAGGGRRATAVVGPAEEVLPALLWAPTTSSLGGVAGRLVLAGVDPRAPDRPSQAAIAVTADPTVADDWLRGAAAVVEVGTVPPLWAPVPPFDVLRTALAGAGAAPGFVATPPPATPGLALVAGDLVIGSPGAGAGVLYVDGRLDIRADFAFSGVVVARGGLELASGTVLVVRGGLWIDGPGSRLDGNARIETDHAALDVVMSLVPLPRRPVVAGILDR